MCDTLIALGSATADGSVIFGKNSDREPNEAHQLLLIPAAVHPSGSVARCTYMEIPQVHETYSVLLAKPFWIWGAEMGANEHGVVIGNEAVFTRVPYDKGPGLIGMDFIRLALERARSAEAALETIVDLLETYGQGGNCGFAHPFYYHNSFIIGDRSDAWVLETAGRQWAAEKVKDVRSISNALTIGKEWELSSSGLIDYAVSRGWCKRNQDFDFARCYSDFLYTTLSDARTRQTCTMDSLKQKKGQITVEMVMGVLRGHGEDGEDHWGPASGLTGADVCMHAGFGPVRGSQSVGSMVSHISVEGITHWLTGTSAPCTGIFKPVWLESGLPEMGPAPTGEYDPAALWWRHEALHRDVLRDYSTRLALYKSERDALEREFLQEETGCKGASPVERLAFSARCFERADAASQEWARRVGGTPVRRPAPFYYRAAWQGFDRQAKRERY